MPTVQREVQALKESGGDCELLPGEAGVTFSQAEAPFDIGKVVVAFTKMVNNELTGVMKVKLDWGSEVRFSLFAPRASPLTQRSPSTSTATSASSSCGPT